MSVCRLNIMKALKSQLEEIQTANTYPLASGTANYRTNVLEVNLEEKSPENIKEFPAINCIFGLEDYVIAEKSQAGRLHKTLNVMLDCYIKSQENKATLITNMIADIEANLFSTLPTEEPAYSLGKTCFVCHPVNTVPFDVATIKHIFGFEFNIKIVYRQDIRNPETLYL